MRFHDLNRLNLLSVESDPTLMGQCLGYRLTREVGVPAPRCNHVELWVNGDFYGVASNAEEADDAVAASAVGTGEGARTARARSREKQTRKRSRQTRSAHGGRGDGGGGTDGGGRAHSGGVAGGGGRRRRCRTTH